MAVGGEAGGLTWLLVLGWTREISRIEEEAESGADGSLDACWRLSLEKKADEIQSDIDECLLLEIEA